MTRLLLTGGCGFIGANLAPMLRARGHEVVILDNLSRGRREFLDDPAAYRVVEADVRDEDAVLAALEGCEAVIHLAARAGVRPSLDPNDVNGGRVML